jgi:5'-nucleotidase / UDP-sugar diphosphatase
MRVTTRADAAIMNGGGIRAGKVYPPGTTITRRDVLAELPFNNRVVTVEVSGRALRQALENGLALMPDAGGRFPQVSGIVLDADLRRPAGDRITSLKIGNAAVDEARIYQVATIDFIARGGDGYVTLRDAKRLLPDEDSPLLANQVMIYLRQLGTVRTGVEGRIVLR